jgi:hypothetical protein
MECVEKLQRWSMSGDEGDLSAEHKLRNRTPGAAGGSPHRVIC